MKVKRRLINTLPEAAKRALAVPYDYVQTRRADRRFRGKDLVERNLSEDAPENIVVVVVDALRGDVLNEELTPFMARLNGVDDAVTPASWTFPSVSSMITGVYPHEHGAMRQHDRSDDSEGLSLPPRMDENRETLTEVLAGAGYRVRGVFGHDTPFVSISGRFHDHELYHNANSDDADVLDAYVDLVKGSDTREFGYVHLAGPHIPVEPPEEYLRKHDVDVSIDNIENWEYKQTVDCGEDCERYREHRRRLYRASVDYVDDALEEFYNSLSDILGEMTVIVTSDHGESMWENVGMDTESFGGTGCVGHGGTPYEAVSRVPLLTNADWGFGDEYVSLVDIAPTVLDLCGLGGTLDTTGRSLVEGPEEGRTPIVEGSISGYEKKAVYMDGYKLILSKGEGSEEGFVVPSEESTEIPDGVRKSMLEVLPPWPTGEYEDGTDVSGVVEDRLADLGYK